MPNSRGFAVYIKAKIRQTVDYDFFERCNNYFCQGSKKQQGLNEAGQILEHNSAKRR